MNIERFFSIFKDEVSNNKDLQKYYKFQGNSNVYEFRKAYFCQRLQYIFNQVKSLIDKSENPSDIRVWDCGCGYGTTSFFLAMNGIRVHGTTIGDHYKEGIPKRLKYWKKYGDSSLFTASYEDLPDCAPEPSSYDAVIVQDTLHHLEPLQQILNVFSNSLRSKGKLIITEPNGSNLFHRTKLYLRRGNKRINEVYDQRLQKVILYGDENFKNLRQWNVEMERQNLHIDQDVQYIKFLLPFFYNGKNTEQIINFEQKLWKNSSLLKEYFFFGMNFTATKR